MLSLQRKSNGLCGKEESSLSRRPRPCWQSKVRGHHHQYAGEYETLADFARELTEETGSVPDDLTFYIDYERMARDLEISDVLTIETGFEQIPVFWRA